MSKIYCMHCGSPTTDLLANFCAKCGKPFLSSKSSVGSSTVGSHNATVKPRGHHNVDDVIEIVDDETTETNFELRKPNLNDVGFSVVEGFEQPVKESLFGVAVSKKTGLVRGKSKKVNKKKVLAEFQAEAGTTRKGEVPK